MSTRDLFGGLITATIPHHALDLNDDPYVFLTLIVYSTNTLDQLVGSGSP
jgi:hypothetical protein